MKCTNKRFFRVVVFVGGAKIGLLRRYLRCKNTIVIVIDNAKEIEKYRKFYQRHGILFFVLAPDETSHSLAKRADKETQLHAFWTANFSTNTGLGARPMFGALAAKMLVESTDFNEHLVKLHDQAIIATAGRPDEIALTILCSDAGATGAGAAPVILDAYARAFSQFGKVVKSTLDLIGPIVFTGTGNRLRQISAASKATLVATARRSSDPDHLTPRQVYFSELPPFGKDQQTRDRALNLEAQAFESAELVADRNVSCSNDSASDILGNIITRETDIIGSIDPELVVSTVASQLAQQLDRAIQAIAEDPELIEEIYLENFSTPIDRPSVESVFASVDSAFIDNILRRLRTPGQSNKFRVVCQLTDGCHLDVQNIANHFGGQPVSATDAVARVNLLLSIQGRLRNESLALQNEVEQLEQIDSQVSDDVQKLTKRLTARRRASQRLATDLMQSMQDNRNVYDELILKSDALELLDSIQQGVHTTLQMHEQILESLHDLLVLHLPTGENRTQAPLVAARPLEESFSELVETVDLPLEEQRLALAELAQHVTLRGLALIGDVSIASHDAIIKAMFYKIPDMIGPPIGGKQRLDSAIDYIVLPKTDTATKDALLNAAKPIASTTKIMFTDTISFGVAAVKFHLRRLDCVATLFDGLTIHELRRAITDPVWRLNFDNALEDLKAIGAVIKDGRIFFPKKEKSDSEDRSSPENK